MHIHLIGVCGTGMGALAGLLRESGHRVSGSDTAFYPPMGDALVRWGVETRQGFDPAHLSPPPDLVIVGNVCRPDNVEARAAIDAGLPYRSLPGALRELYLSHSRSFVVAGTHGKTTTSTLLSYLLDRCGKRPGFLIGGLPVDFEHSFRPPMDDDTSAPFVVEGDEYDSAFFEKYAKFLQYEPQVASINAIEHDHIDIYPDMNSYLEAFRRFVDLLPESGLLVVNAADAHARGVAAKAKCQVLGFALADDAAGSATADVVAMPRGYDEGMQRFDLDFAGERLTDLSLPMSGGHNLRNALAALAMAHAGAGVPLAQLAEVLPRFGGVRRRQELRGTPGGVRVYDDFAHHPTAVAETLAGLRARHPAGKLIATFEPRSATASRNLHQAVYPAAFDAADIVLLSPVGRPEIADDERLDVGGIAEQITRRGPQAQALPSVDAIVERVRAVAEAGDTVVAMSNGAFGGIYDKLLAALA